MITQKQMRQIAIAAAKESSKAQAALLLRYETERQLRCGDGTGKITSHSVNCICIDRNGKHKAQ